MSEELKNALKTLTEEFSKGTIFQFIDQSGQQVQLSFTNAQCVETLDGTKTIQIW